MKIIGREKEKGQLERIYRSKEPEFLAVYGRRRVGKTHLVREFFSLQKGVYFELVGQKGGGPKEHLELFISSFVKAFKLKGHIVTSPGSWNEALKWLTEQIELLPKSECMTLFFDEMPWIAGKRSGFLGALDHFWNAHWSKMTNVKLIACGSAASWMLKNIINAKGGLHNRITASILLKPLDLHQTAAFLKERGFRYNHNQILSLYMAIGGIPHYLKQVEKGKSVAQNIHGLCFEEGGLLREEFKRLFASLFEHSENHERIIRAIAKRKGGVPRKELKEKTGGTLTKRLHQLEASGFIRSFTPYGRESRDRVYRVIDEYTLFYLRWIEPTLNLGYNLPSGYWTSQSKTPAYYSWAGLSFEAVCFKHISQIINALGLGNTPCIGASWSHLASQSKDKGAQIDLLFDREDDAITICEIKHTSSAFKIDKEYASKFLKRIDVFKQVTGANKQLFLGIISSSGLQQNPWSEELVDHTVTLDDLFRER